jgi:hypothetical protein
MSAAPDSSPSSRRAPKSSRRSPKLALALDALWAAASDAQRDGDHARAEGVFATLVKVAPLDCEAWFQKAIAAGWASPPGKPRFDEMIVSMGVALEVASPVARRELRRRGARAAALLAEVTYDDVSEASDARRLAQARASLRLLDFATELDPTFAAAPRAALRIVTEALELARSEDAPREIFTSLCRAERAAKSWIQAQRALH